MREDSGEPRPPVCPKCGEALEAGVCLQCTVPISAEVVASVSDPESELLRSAVGDEYEILEEVGRGGMAVVYRAREHALGRDVAIKVLPLARAHDPEFVTRFQEEARTAASLDHPSIVPIYRVAQVDRINFIVMKYVRGSSLAEILESRGPLEAAEVGRMLLEVSEALDEAHARGIVHRDIKPANIMKDGSGRYVVMDFGIARPFGRGQHTEMGGALGTPKYMSPEQARGADLEGRSDFYSLGVVAYECLAGHPPFEGDEPTGVLYAHLHEPVPEPDSIPSGNEGARVFDAIRKLLDKDPKNRLCGAEEVRRTLEGAPGHVASSAPSGSVLPWSVASRIPDDWVRWWRNHSRSGWIGAVVVGLLLVVVAVSRDDLHSRCEAALASLPSDSQAVIVEPLETVRQGSEVEISYIACGVPDGERIRLELTVASTENGGVIGGVRRIFRGESDAVRLSWDDVSGGFATAGTRSVSPGELEPGSYRASILMRAGGGDETEGEMDFVVVER